MVKLPDRGDVGFKIWIRSRQTTRFVCLVARRVPMASTKLGARGRRNGRSSSYSRGPAEGVPPRGDGRERTMWSWETSIQCHVLGGLGRCRWMISGQKQVVTHVLPA